MTIKMDRDSDTIQLSAVTWYNVNLAFFGGSSILRCCQIPYTCILRVLSQYDLAKFYCLYSISMKYGWSPENDRKAVLRPSQQRFSQVEANLNQ